MTGLWGGASLIRPTGNSRSSPMHELPVAPIRRASALAPSCRYVVGVGPRPPILLCMGLFSIFWVDSRGGHAPGLPGRSARPQRPDHAYRSDDTSMRNCASAIIGSVLINSMSYRARNWPSAVSLRGSLPPGFRPAARSLARRPSCCRRTRRAASRLMLLIPARRV